MDKKKEILKKYTGKGGPKGPKDYAALEKGMKKEEKGEMK